MTLVIYLTEAFFVNSFLGNDETFGFRSIFFSDVVHILGSVRVCRIVGKNVWSLLAEEIPLTSILIRLGLARLFVSNVGGDLFLVFGLKGRI